MEKTYKVETYDVDYCVEEEDLLNDFEDTDLEEGSEEYEEAMKEAIKDKKDSLPQGLILTITCEKEDLEELVCDELTELTGWLINSFKFKVLERR